MTLRKSETPQAYANTFVTADCVRHETAIPHLMQIYPPVISEKKGEI